MTKQQIFSHMVGDSGSLDGSWRCSAVALGLQFADYDGL